MNIIYLTNLVLLLCILAKGEKKRTKRKRENGKKKQITEKRSGAKEVYKCRPQREKRKEAWKRRDWHFHTKETPRGVGRGDVLPLPDPYPTLTLAAYQDAESHK